MPVVVGTAGAMSEFDAGMADVVWMRENPLPFGPKGRKGSIGVHAVRIVDFPAEVWVVMVTRGAGRDMANA